MKVCNNCYHIAMYQNKDAKVSIWKTTNGIEDKIICEKCGRKTDQLFIVKLKECERS